MPPALPTRLREEGARYLVVGIWNTAFGYGLFALLYALLEGHVHYTLILLIASVVSVISAYALQRRLVFRASGSFARGLARFSTVYAAGFVVNIAALPLLVEVLHTPVLVAQAGILLVTVVASFFIHRAYTFA